VEQRGAGELDHCEEIVHYELMKLLVLAAGIGSRFGGVKQIASVGPNGEALLEYSLFDALACGL